MGGRPTRRAECHLPCPPICVSASSRPLRWEPRAGRRRGASRSAPSAVRWHETFVQKGRTQAKPMGGDQRSLAVEAQVDLIPTDLRGAARAVPHELRDRLPSVACGSE